MTWVSIGSHYDDSDVISTWSNRMFRQFRRRLAKEAGIDLTPFEAVVRRLGRGSKRTRALMPFFLAAFLHTEMFDDEARSAAAAISDLTAAWPADDPMRLHTDELIEGMSDVDGDVFVSID